MATASTRLSRLANRRTRDTLTPPTTRPTRIGGNDDCARFGARSSLEYIAWEVYLDRALDYQADMSHPCVRFVFDTLAEWQQRFRPIAEQARTLHWRCGLRADENMREFAIKHYARLWHFGAVAEPREGDVALMRYGRRLGHVGLFVDSERIAHVAIKTRILNVEPANQLEVQVVMRR